MAESIARFFKSFVGVFDWLDNKMWHASQFYPDRFYARLDKYSRETALVQEIRWERRRYQGDHVWVELIQIAEDERLRQIAIDISKVMEDGSLSINFLLAGNTVAHCRMVNGQLQPSDNAGRSTIHDLFALP